MPELYHRRGTNFKNKFNWKKAAFALEPRTKLGFADCILAESVSEAKQKAAAMFFVVRKKPNALFKVLESLKPSCAPDQKKHSAQILVTGVAQV